MRRAPQEGPLLAALAQEPLLEPAALEVGVEFRLDVVGQGAACLGAQHAPPGAHRLRLGHLAFPNHPRQREVQRVAQVAAEREVHELAADRRARVVAHHVEVGGRANTTPGRARPAPPRNAACGGTHR
jgi:hypothetical protein